MVRNNCNNASNSRNITSNNSTSRNKNSNNTSNCSNSSKNSFQLCKRIPSSELCKVVKLCQVVGVFPGARMNDGTEAGRLGFRV